MNKFARNQRTASVDHGFERMNSSLQGIRVLDLSRILAGPWATQILADLGAEIIKIERPGAGDDTRSWGPPYARSATGGKESAYFLGANRGKKSVVVDLKKPEGVDLVRRIARTADVVIENFKTGDLQRYQLDAATLRQSNPRLIYCSITGFGQSGPRAKTAGYDLMIQGMAGLMSITGEADDVVGGGPMKVGVAMVDILTGLYATIAVLAALQERQHSGVGKDIDLALFDVCVASQANQTMNWLVSGAVPGRMGNLHPNIAPYQTFATSDGHIILAVGNDAQFRKTCEVLERPSLADDPDFASNSARVENRRSLTRILQQAFSLGTCDQWLARLRAQGVPCGPINAMDQVFSDPHARARDLARTLPHGTLGEAPAVANPIHFNGVSVTGPNSAPALGEHTSEVLADILGLDPDAIAALVESGVATCLHKEGSR